MIGKQELEIRFAQVSETAAALIEEERAARQQKTARLRALRLAQRHEPALRSTAGGANMASKKRVVFNSSLTKDGWMVTSGGEPVSNHETQEEAEAAAIAAARTCTRMGDSVRPFFTRPMA